MATDLILQSGTNHEIKTTSTSVYFFHVTRTGAEEYMKTAPVKVLRSRSTQGVKRSFEVEYEVLQPFTLKMVSIQTAFGKKKQVSTIFMEVNPDANIIELYGLASFGYLKGGGILDLNKTSLTPEELKAMHQYRVICMGRDPHACTGSFARRIIV